jgi:hypothetical protein
MMVGALHRGDRPAVAVDQVGQQLRERVETSRPRPYFLDRLCARVLVRRLF